MALIKEWDHVYFFGKRAPFNAAVSCVVPVCRTRALPLPVMVFFLCGTEWIESCEISDIARILFLAFNIYTCSLAGDL